MNNEPVAWINKSKLNDWLHGDCYPDQCFIHYPSDDAIPLYTHPAKTLTDEEIVDIADRFGINKYSLKMAISAILRKAQEK